MQSDFEGRLSAFNERFYVADPSDYLQRRLNQWMVTAEEAGAFPTLREPTATESETALEATEVDESILSFLTIDAVVLHHHAAESLVRYYLAHSNNHPAPWTDIASQRAGFKRLVINQLIEQTPDSDDVAAIVYGTSTPWSGVNTDTWCNAVEGLVDFLQSMARAFINGAPMYNSIKHGLGSSPGRADVVFAVEIADPNRPTVAEINEGHRLGSGPSVDYPTFEKIDDGRLWSVTTEWVDVERAIRLVIVAIRMLHSIREVGRRRRTDAGVSDDAPIEFFFPDSWRASHMRSDRRTPAHSMSIPFLRETKNA